MDESGHFNVVPIRAERNADFLSHCYWKQAKPHNVHIDRQALQSVALPIKVCKDDVMLIVCVGRCSSEMKVIASYV